MKDKNILSIGIIIGIAAILLIGGFYFIVSEPKSSENGSGETPTSYVSNDTEISYPSTDSKVEINTGDMETPDKTTIGHIPSPERMPNIMVSFTKIPHNTKPIFKVGDKFEYISGAVAIREPVYNISEEDNISPSSTYQIPGKSICNVINKERLRGEEYYVVKCNNELLMMGGGIIKEKDVYYISTENGEIRKVIHNSTIIYKDIEQNMESFSGDIPSPNSEIYTAGFYSPWMLSLSDDFKMEIKTSHPTVAKEEISVIDEEKIKNRKCYLVEYRQLDKNNKVIFREKKWIDKEKRILIKSEAYLGSLRIDTIELVSDIK